MGWNNFGIEVSSGWGSNAVPAAGTCAGVKYGTAGAGLFAGDCMSRSTDFSAEHLPHPPS